MPQKTRRAGLMLACLLAMLALCSSAEGYSNGRLPDSQLASIGGCAKLRWNAAAAWNTLQLRAGVRLGPIGCGGAAYRRIGRSGDYPRVYGTQFYWRGYWCALSHCENAAVPGTSNHGWGLALDVPAWVRSYVDARGAAYGWAKRWSDAPHEWWHLRYRPGVWKHRPNPGTHLKSPLLRKGSGGPGQSTWVRYVQKRLRQHGQPKTKVDGAFGPRTKQRVRTFQRRHHLHADGVVGLKTWRALRKPEKRR